MEERIKDILNRLRITKATCTPKSSGLIFPLKYSRHEVGDMVHQAIKTGIEIGLHESSVKGQRISLQRSVKTPKQEEYIKKLYALHDEYGMGFRYHPLYGMELFELEKKL